MKYVIWNSATGDYFDDKSGSATSGRNDGWISSLEQTNKYIDGRAWELMGYLTHAHGKTGMQFVSVVSLPEAIAREIMES